MFKKRLALLALSTLLLTACTGKDPGLLEGTWKSSIGTTITFRAGESEADGNVWKVSYKVSGNEVRVVHTEGPTKGNTARFTIIDADTAKTDYMTIQRVK